MYLVGQVRHCRLLLSIGGAELRDAMQAAAQGNAQQLAPEAADRISLAVLVGSALFVPLSWRCGLRRRW